MFPLNHDSASPEVRKQGVRNLGGEPLLQLRSASEDVDGSGQLAEPGHLAWGWEVGDMGSSEERLEVMFAGAGELDVAQDNHVIRSTLMIELASQMASRIIP